MQLGELLAQVNEKPLQTGELESAFSRRVFDRVNALPDADWQKLPENVQQWANEAGTAVLNQKDVPSVTAVLGVAAAPVASGRVAVPTATTSAPPAATTVPSAPVAPVAPAAPVAPVAPKVPKAPKPPKEPKEPKVRQVGITDLFREAVIAAGQKDFSAVLAEFNAQHADRPISLAAAGIIEYALKKILPILKANNSLTGPILEHRLLK